MNKDEVIFKEKDVMIPQNTELLILQKSVDAREDEIHLLQDFIRELGEEKETLQSLVMAADEKLKFVRTQRDEYDRLVEDYKNALIIRDEKLVETRERLAKAVEANYSFKSFESDYNEQGKKFVEVNEKLAEAKEILDKAQNQLRLTVETMAAFRKSTPSEKSFVALMKALEKNFGLESRDIGKSKKKKK